MPSFCLIPEQVRKFKTALKDGTLNPEKLGKMSSKERREFLEKLVGSENGKQVNALFESKLLLKNQKAGYISWAKRISGMSPQAKRDLVSRIERMDKILDPDEEKVFLEDLASQRLGFGVTESEAKKIFDLAKKTRDLKAKADTEGVFTSKDDRLAYGWANIQLEDYVNKLKLQSRKISFREQPLRATANLAGQVPGTLKSLLSSLDNSFFGRQGIKTLLDFKTSNIWVKNFAKSFGDVGKELLGKDAMNAIRADIYSRPNALNGKYKAGRYGLDVLSEEAFPSSLPSKIPLFGRLYKASESAYNGGALRLRADLADRFIKIAEKQGINTSSPEQAKFLGEVIGSLTGRGALGKGEVFAKEANVLLFSVKFLKANIDTLLAPSKFVGRKAFGKFKNKGDEFASREAAKSTLRIVLSVSALLATAKLLDPSSVEEDPRSPNFGKIKVFGRWTDITGGMSSIVTLAMRVLPTQHDGQWGFWSKNKQGGYTDLTSGKYGQETALDTFQNFFEGKLSPSAGLVRDLWTGKTYSGDPVTPQGQFEKSIKPITVQTFEQMVKDPDSSNILGSMILEGLGFSTSPQTYPKDNIPTIPEGERISKDNFINSVLVYTEALGTDPETAFSRIFSGQKILKTENGAIIVERMDVGDSQAIKKKYGKDTKEVKLDHTIPLQLGGSNEESNLKIISTAEHSSYTKTENALGKALKAKKINKEEAQKLIIEFKNIKDTNRRKKFGEELQQKYK